MARKIPLQRKSRPKQPRTGDTQPRLSRTHRPDDLPVADWQVGLRRQFGREQAFSLENIGSEPLFSEFGVSNPASRGCYRVAIRGIHPGDNFCACADFATNDLGTCKHIEFVLAKLAARRGGKRALERGFQPPYTEIYLHYAGTRSLRLRPGAECPAALLKRAAAIFDAGDGWRARTAHADRLDEFLRAAQKSGHELRCYDDALAFVAAARDAQARHRVLDAAYPQGAGSEALAGLLKVPMYAYQAEGALFAARAGRALIGDEMGLGKTVQAIAAMELLARHCGAERVLIVCPTSLKHQWQRELDRFSGRTAQVIQGGRTLRQQQYRDGAFCKIANYDTLARDLDLIQAWAPDLVIADEAQRIKNWNTVAARALKRIESPYAVVLTGTPLENRLEELISIVQFVDRHRLGPTWRLLHEHQHRDDDGRVVGYRHLDRLGATLAPILIRRRKKEVLNQLPERLDKNFFVPMTEPQKVFHEENRQTVARIIQRWRRMRFLTDADQRRLTCCLQNMRMSCNSTYLLDGETDHGCKVDELVNLLEDLFERPEAKAVIFSSWLRTHELIVRRLEARGWGHVLFHGGVPGDKRGALVDRFHNEPGCRVFLSTDAGGVGLNLQHAASTIINMDLPWNPAVLEQRIGRVHRMGQTRGVQVINFVAEGTIEEGMLSLLAFKKSLFAGVLDGGEQEVFMNGTRLAQFIESVEAATSAASGAMSAPDEGVGAEPATTAAADDAVAQAPVETSAAGPANPWAPLLQVGLELAGTLAAASAGSTTQGGGWIETDARTGQSYLRLPLPEPAAVQKLASALTQLLAGLKQQP